MYLTYAFVLLFACANVLSKSVTICKLVDKKCMLEHGQAIYLKVLERNPETGAEDLDPMHHDVIDGKTSILTYKVTNATVEGFKKCKVVSFEIDATTLEVHTKLLCSEFKFYGTYDMHGKLKQDLPVEGNGDYDLKTKEYSININVMLEVVKESDGRSYVAAKSYSVMAEALGPIVFKFQNLFNGQKDLADPVHKFVNENWKEVSNQLQGPAFDAYFKKIMSNLNKFFKQYPAENVI